ncbi:ROK family protein [Yeguia hominis]|uniref:ROK family transcriptional regulator n=1 Tax=Yeguia hominis TaxID=2763662 RepID=A0A926HRY8_9FIRM|nr:ROK family transcriptional regulator [Yeguia hominis]
MNFLYITALDFLTISIIIKLDLERGVAMSATHVKNMQFLRKSNRATIIKHLATQGPSSRIELSSQLGLTKMAVSNIVAEMIEEKLITESGLLTNGQDKKSPSSGRKRTALSLLPYSINGIAIWITRFQLHCLAIEITGQIFCHLCKEIPQNADNQFVVRTLCAMISNILEIHSDKNFIGIGIASIGPLDIQQKKLLAPPNFYEIKDLEIGRILEEQFQCPVFLDNDMNGIALAEQLYGIGKEMTDLVYVGFGSGVGAGIIANGKILHGRGGYAGELGHVSINPEGERCSCGQRGCLELYTGLSTFLKNCNVNSIKELRRKMEANPVPELISNNLLAFQRAVQKALISVANLFDPEIIIVGDQMLPMMIPMLPEIEAYMNTHMFHHGFRNIKLVQSSFGSRAPLIGAGAILFQKIFSSEISIPSNN